MITTEMLGRIRRMHLRDKVSLHEIAKRTGLSRNTVRSWLRATEEVQIPTYRRAAGFGKLSGIHHTKRRTHWGAGTGKTIKVKSFNHAGLDGLLMTGLGIIALYAITPPR